MGEPRGGAIDGALEQREQQRDEATETVDDADENARRELVDVFEALAPRPKKLKRRFATEPCLV